jgi:hypothetical protein
MDTQKPWIDALMKMNSLLIADGGEDCPSLLRSKKRTFSLTDGWITTILVANKTSHGQLIW